MDFQKKTSSNQSMSVLFIIGRSKTKNSGQNYAIFKTLLGKKFRRKIGFLCPDLFTVCNEMLTKWIWIIKSDFLRQSKAIQRNSMITGD